MKQVKLICLILTMLGCCPGLFAQNMTITGKVIDVNSEPIIGANVTEKGTTNGTITDIDGNFSLNAPQGATLVISYIGYLTQEVKIASQTSLKIILKENAEALEEVVVVGVSMKRSDLTGAISQVSSKVLEEKPVTTINEALQGRVAGVMINTAAKPSDDSSIKIRGVNTINSGSTPIYVIDGLVMGNDQGGFNSINVNDVASVQVLKDASATALYGSRGANGVVLITTKKGKEGVGKVNYDGWFGITKMSQRPKTMSAQELFDLRLDAFANGYMYNNPDGNRQDYIDNTLLKTNIAFHDQEFDTYRSGQSYDWLDQVVQTGYQQNHNISFSKGTDNSSIYISLGYSDVKGLVKTTEQTRYSGRVNAETNIKSWLKVGTNTSFNHVKDGMPSDDVYNKALWANPLLNYNPYKDDATRHDKDYLTLFYRAHSEENNNDYNPFNSLEVIRDRTRNRITSSNFLNINPIEGLNIRTSFAIDYSTQAWYEYTPTGIQESIRGNEGDSKAKHERWEYMNWQWDNSITYDKTIGKHRINALFSTSTSRINTNYTKAEGSRFASDDLTYKDLAGAALKNKTYIGSDFTGKTLVSFVGRANYDYDKRYFATATLRYDGSSKFADGNRWGLFPSFSLAWEMTNEAFMEDQNIFDRLKLRAGYGAVGNQDIEDFVYATLYYSTINDGIPTYSGTGLRGNPSISWESQKQTNIGIDMSFLNDRLSVSLDGFFIKNEGLLQKYDLPGTFGYNQTWGNIGVVENKGFEATINANIIKTKDFNWNLSVNYSMDKNKVTELYEGADILSNENEREKSVFLNQSLNSIYTYKYGGIANESNREQWEGITYYGKTVGLGDIYVLDLSGPDGKPDGIIDQHDRTIVGKSDPKFYGGFSTDFSYKGFTLNAVFNYSYGAKKISPYYESLASSVGLSMATPDLKDRWTPDNTGAKFPRVVTNATDYNRYSPSESDFTLQNASYLRLATLTLAYNFPSSMLAKAKISNLRLYVTGSNLFCATKYKGFDPETGDWGYPPTKMYVFGLNFSF